MMTSITYQVTVFDDRTEWRLDGQLHRTDGPAVEYANGNRFWYLNGQRHRVDGPAVESADGTCYWYLTNEEVTEAEHRRQTAPAEELTVADI